MVKKKGRPAGRIPSRHQLAHSSIYVSSELTALSPASQQEKGLTGTQLLPSLPPFFFSFSHNEQSKTRANETGRDCRMASEHRFPWPAILRLVPFFLEPKALDDIIFTSTGSVYMRQTDGLSQSSSYLFIHQKGPGEKSPENGRNRLQGKDAGHHQTAGWQGATPSHQVSGRPCPALGSGACSGRRMDAQSRCWLNSRADAILTSSGQRGRTLPHNWAMAAACWKPQAL